MPSDHRIKRIRLHRTAMTRSLKGKEEKQTILISPDFIGTLTYIFFVLRKMSLSKGLSGYARRDQWLSVGLGRIAGGE